GCRPWNYHEQLATIPAEEAWRPLEQGEYPLQITQRAGRPSNQACLSDLQAAAMPSDCTERDVDRAFATLGQPRTARLGSATIYSSTAAANGWLPFVATNRIYLTNRICLLTT